ncbi:HAMP domain-containing histidine kinase [Salinirubellus salinus]|jgi:signal transduction histidine kinase|uniref:histidine kinase n=1 Tax=Salinirubellus salinus TaxID=1364945 RepID=A0A9E7R749_9EURY|nr:HAMP domain-containing sensor histidine kinase [Salinirubellus salinus]UWM56696.1 HAMP domain-containing histidine kinase [Salinirubellus salinus]
MIDGNEPPPAGGTERASASERGELATFAATVSHDLRNPLLVARGNLELLDASGVDTGSRSHVEAARAALDRADRIIDDLETYAENGYRMGEQESVSLEGVASLVWTDIASPDAELVVESDGEVLADPAILRQLFENVLQNALTHAGPDVTVRLGTFRAAEAGPDAEPLGFYVADDGPGVPQGERTGVFDAGVSTGGGTGYGLAIVRRFAADHGWSARVTRAADGGARFEFAGVTFVS